MRMVMAMDLVLAARDGVIEPNPFLWVMAVLWVALGVAAIRLTPKIWRGQGPETERVEATFGRLGSRTGPALISALPLSGPLLVLAGVMLLAGLLREAAESSVEDVAHVVTLTVGIPLVALLPVFFMVLLFNRPKRFVPPALRDRRGLLF